MASSHRPPELYSQVGMHLIFIFSFILTNYMASYIVFLSFEKIIGGLTYEKYP